MPISTKLTLSNQELKLRFPQFTLTPALTPMPWCPWGPNKMSLSLVSNFTAVCQGFSIHTFPHIHMVRSWRCGCLVTWFCYQMIAKPGNKTAAPSWVDPYSKFWDPTVKFFWLNLKSFGAFGWFTTRGELVQGNGESPDTYPLIDW